MIGLNGFLRLNKQKGVLFIDVREVGKYLKIPDEDGDTDQEVTAPPLADGVVAVIAVPLVRVNEFGL